MSPAMKKSTGKQIVLSFLLVAIIFSTFGMVFAVDYYYSNLNGTSAETQIFVTDSNTEFPNIEFDPVGLPSPYFDSFTTGQYHAVLPNFWQFNKTPAYLGNDTWSVSVNDTSQSVSPQFLQIVMSIDNLENVVLTRIVMNVTLNADADLTIISDVHHFNSPQSQVDTTVATNIHNDLSAGGITYYNRSIPISLTNSLRIYDISQETNTNLLTVLIVDKNGDGLSAWACQWTITLYGRSITGWSEQSSLALVLMLGTVFNAIGGWYALDQNDWGKDKRDIPPKRKKTTSPRPKRKSKSKRRSK